MDGAYSVWLLERMAVTTDFLQRMGVTTDGCYNGWCLQRLPRMAFIMDGVTADEFVNGWCLQGFAFLTDCRYKVFSFQRMRDTTVGCYNDLFL